MTLHYKSPSILICDSESEDIHVFIDGYQEGTTDPALKLVVDDYISNNTNITKPNSVLSKYYKLGTKRIPENELTKNEKDEFTDWHENIVDTEYRDDNHIITHREISVEVGASSLTEEVIIALITGPASAVLTVILVKLFELYGYNAEPLSDEEIHIMIRRLLKDKYGASDELNFISTKKSVESTKYVLEDDSGSKYHVQFSQSNGIQSVRVKK